MDANPHNQPAPTADLPYQGVVIEQYRGPLLSQPQTRSGISVSHTPDYSAPLFAFDVPPPEWLAEQPQPRRPTRLRRWLTRMFRSDDEVLNSAKRGWGWMLIVLACYLMIAITSRFPGNESGFIYLVYAVAVTASCLSPLPILVLLPLALKDSVISLRNYRHSQYPRLALRFSFVTFVVSTILLVITLWSVVQIGIVMSDLGKY